MPSIFVSHAHQDNAWCRPFVEALKSLGLDVWYDEKGLQGGADWLKTIERELEARDIFLIILTPAAWQSEWVQRELGLAFTTNRRILPVLHQPTQVTGFIRGIQWVDVVGQSAVVAAQRMGDVVGPIAQATYYPSVPTYAPPKYSIPSKTTFKTRTLIFTRILIFTIASSLAGSLIGIVAFNLLFPFSFPFNFIIFLAGVTACVFISGYYVAYYYNFTSRFNTSRSIFMGIGASMITGIIALLLTALVVNNSFDIIFHLQEVIIIALVVGSIGSSIGFVFARNKLQHEGV